MLDLLQNTYRTIKFALLPTLFWAAVFFMLCLVFRRKKLSGLRILKMLLLCFYAALLLYGTVFSRATGIADFFTPHLRDGQLFVWHFDPTSALSRIHFFSNILLFIPFGFLAMLSMDGGKKLFKCVTLGLICSCLIETFQLLHMLTFDFGDLFANTLGTLIGALICLPFVYKKLKN